MEKRKGEADYKHGAYGADPVLAGLIFSVSWVDTGVTEFLKLLGYVPKGRDAYLPNLSGGLVVPALLVIALMPAIFEEQIFYLKRAKPFRR